MKKSKITEAIMLSILVHRKVTGYELYSLINTKMNYFIDISKSSTYYLLEKMHKEKYLNLKNQKNSSKKIYSLTPKGKEYLKELLFEIIEGPIIDPFEIAAFCFDKLDYKTKKGIISRRIERYNEFTDILDNHKGKQTDNFEFIYSRATKFIEEDKKLLTKKLNEIKNEK